MLIGLLSVGTCPVYNLVKAETCTVQLDKTEVTLRHQLRDHIGHLCMQGCQSVLKSTVQQDN